MSKERTISGIKVVVSGETYDEYKGTLQEQLEEKDKEIERLKEELKYTIPIVEHNKTITKHLKEIERLNNIIEEAREYINIELLIKYRQDFELIEISHIKKILEILDKGE